MKIATFYRMPYQEQKMFFINFFLCALAKIAIHCLSYKRLSAYFGHFRQMLVASTLPSTQQIQQALSIKRSIVLTARYTLWDSTCLTQALVAKFWCQRYQIPYFLFIGLAKEKKQSSDINAHAWITVGPIAITGGHALVTHHVICSYSNV